MMAQEDNDPTGWTYDKETNSFNFGSDPSAFESHEITRIPEGNSLAEPRDWAHGCKVWRGELGPIAKSIAKVPDQKYEVIYADPPWDYTVWTKSTLNYKRQMVRVAKAFYETMKLDEIKALGWQGIIQDLAAKTCLLFLWTTAPCLPEALEVIKAWGFRFRTVAFIWHKTNGDLSFDSKYGLGHYTRSNSDQVLLATRGPTPTKLIINHSIKQVWDYPIGEHSTKPVEFASHIDRLVGYERRKIELFARNAYLNLRDNWDYWGLEA